MNMKTWKIGIVKDTSKPMLGLHGLHVAFRGLPNVQVVAHVDSNTQNIKQKMAATQAQRHYTSLSQMLDQEHLDIVVLCSRHPDDHLPQIKMAAQQGVHLYCEKPMTRSLDEADQIIELAKKHRIKIGMAHPTRYALAFRTMKEMIHAGKIGTPLTAYGRGKCDHRGGGEDLIVLGTHILDLQTFIFGDPESVWADVTTKGKPIDQTSRIKTVEPLGPVAGDSIFACFNFANDMRCIFESRRNLLHAPSGHIHMGLTVVGTKGTLSLRFNDSFDATHTLRISRTPSPPEDHAQYEEVPLNETRVIPDAQPLDDSLSGKPDIPREPFFLQANRFAAWDLMQAIKEDRMPISNLHNARLALEMIYGIYASQLTGHRIEFPLTHSIHPLKNEHVQRA